MKFVYTDVVQKWRWYSRNFFIFFLDILVEKKSNDLFRWFCTYVCVWCVCTNTHRINILRNQVFFRMMDIFRSSSTSTGQTFKSLTAIFFFFEFKFHSSPSISQYWWWALAKKTNKWMIKRETKIKPSFLLLFCFDHGSFKNDNGGIK